MSRALDTLRGIFADGIVWHSPGSGPLAGDSRGVDEVLGLFAKVEELSAGTLRNDCTRSRLVTVRGEREGKTLENLPSHVFHVSDGGVTEVWLEAFDLYANDEFWS